MPAYSYQALDLSGKKTKGRIEASDRQTALQELKQAGIHVIGLEEFTGSIWTKDLEIGSKRIPSKDFVPFLRQFATLFKAGVTLVESLRILAEQTTNKKLQKILPEVAAQVARGNQLSEAFLPHQVAFPPVFVNLIRAGEVTGNLEEVLERLADLMEKEHYTREKVKSALTYPAIIGLVTIVVSAYLLIKVIPNFVKNLSRSGRELPAMTKLVMSVSAHLVQYWHWYLIALVLLFISARLALKKDRVRYSFDLLKLQLPLFGPLFQKAALARCSRTVATLLQSAVPTLQVFTVAANVVGNEVYARALRGARDSLREGSLISVPLRQEKMFPPLVTQMVAIGEQTGQLDRMFSKIADFYEADVETTVDKLRPMIEPLMILILSVVVGVIITAAIAPIFEMYRSVKN